ncbi:NAD-dependent epimerase/dehydratase family protein [Rhodococcus sp. PAMC28707]|uniref:NAD-dependent epimerase/dehydratase family protein n=1 Tax=unclassified Rhodococcus (in: high G+C Gram-positive bacteria) TaxID=192944 RepID=UPI00109DBF5D|nr:MULTISPECIES: NAD-dependent epimerase/dehydratase family protein [unclassified Rhodococcus (in: high G+C Gram-positive bacteria)]QCB50630.1 NAD-dependent epimerase/dehydratase family protein [Rhodococcus sp. PAMC28705]QCB57678.1 NAD-dependent epimerase/dehydratase family protein [Rhodococcus sp. PAMC28707]
MTLRIAVTGVTSDFAAAILPVLLDDDDIGSVIGVARRPLALEHRKLTSVQADIRSPDLENIFRGCDVVLHLAFVVEELRDKSQTHDINQRGSRNVLDSAYRAGVRRLVITSSINAYGAELHDEPLDENTYPAGDPDRYYFHDKAEVEHYAEWWLRRHPGEMNVSMLRPTYIIGPDFSNDGIDQFTSKIGAFPQADRASYQFLHQRDLADAYHRATKQDLNGPYNVGPRDWTGVRELADMQGQILFDVPERPAIRLANLTFRLGLTPFSGQWVTAGEPVVDSTALHDATGWSPTLSSRECAAIMILQQSKPLLRARYALVRHAACESALEPASTSIGISGGDHEHVQLPIGIGSVHCEVHRSTGLGTVVIPVRPGLHARYLTPTARILAASGLDVVLLDLPGHGLSTGRRGRTSQTEFDAAVAAATAHARAEFGGPLRVIDVGEQQVNVGRVRAMAGALRGAPGNRLDGLLPKRVRVTAASDRFPTARTAEEVIELCGLSPFATRTSRTALPRA